VTEGITTGFKLKIKHALCLAEVLEAPVQQPFENLRVTESITTGFLIKGNKILRLSG
jgi:hypothetical protein